MHIGLISGGSNIGALAYRNHAVFASEYDYEYKQVIKLLSDAPYPYYPKLKIIEDELKYYDWIVWIDSDLFITDFSRDNFRKIIFSAAQDDTFFVAAEGPHEVVDTKKQNAATKTLLNSGLLLLKNDPRTYDLLKIVKSMSVDKMRSVWDVERYGAFTSGDQDAFILALQRPEFSEQYKIVSYSLLNAREHHYHKSLNEHFAVHFCGPEKVSRINYFARRLGVRSDLVPLEYASRYHLPAPPRSNAMYDSYRLTSVRIRKFQKRIRRKIAYIRETGRWK
ncbi:hypothetical protein [Actinomyces vulturis]|uniref:hypothetical protein n=1 Tax=Actinomyces vulturis TaxID=1857645 RepID=UPI000833CFF9|nr:hypothetical protein [Actinomyces vulturis]